MKWTEDALRAEAAKYDTKKKFQRGNSGGYSTALTRFPGLLDEIFGESFRWTEDALRAETVKYDTKKKFQTAASGAYNAARRFPGLLDKLFEGKGKRSWNEQRIRDEASKYSSRGCFQTAANGAYNAANKRFPGLLEELFGEKRRQWDEHSVRVESAKYSTKVEFQHACKGGYVAALRLGIWDKLFEGKGKRSWNEQRIRDEASKYSSKWDLGRCARGAYDAAHRRFPGLLDELFENQHRYTDGDIFYIWRANDYEWMGHPVYKFGITSSRLGMTRINQCAQLNRIRATDVKLFQTDTASKWERLFHDVFPVVPDLGFKDGRTEFRACCPKTLQEMVSIILPKPNN